jgi:gas vesicle protein
MKPDLVGQSLGGKIGQQLTVEVPDYIHSLITFNSIGISTKEFEKYQGKVKIYHYINPADLVPYLLGEKFLPGIIFQVCNTNIKTSDLLGQHNNLVLANSLTLIKEVEVETFYCVREFYKCLKDYSNLVQKKVEELSQTARKELTECGENLKKSGQEVRKDLQNSRQAIQQEFIKIMQAVRQDLLEDIKGTGSTQLLHKTVNDSIEAIQKEVEKWSKTIQQEIQGPGNTFKNFSQVLQQELRASVGTIKQKLDKFLPR